MQWTWLGAGVLMMAGMTGTVGTAHAAGDATPATVAASAPSAGAGPVGASELTDALLAGDAARPVPAKLPASAFAAIPMFLNPVLSPDGLHYAARVYIDGHRALGIFDLTGKQPTHFMGLPDADDLIRYFWVGNDWVVLSFGQTVPWLDDEAYATRLEAIEVATGKPHFVGATGEGVTGDDVLWVDPAGTRLLLSYQPSIYEYPSVFSVDIANNRSTHVAGPYDNIWHWHADTAGVVRHGNGWIDDHHWQMVYRKDATQPFRVVAKGTDRDDDLENAAEDKAFSIAAGSDAGYAYATDEQSGLTAIYRYDFAQHKRGDLVFEAPGSDVDDAALTDDGKDMFSAVYTDNRDRVKWWDPAMQALQNDLDKAVTGVLGTREAWVISQNRDHSIMFVWVLGSNDPGSYYVYQTASGNMQRVLTLNEQLPPRSLVVSHYVHYTARDGTDIPAYLTLPAGRAPKGLPLIVMPHGGPYGIRDHGDFDADAQFLANRGYVVLQPQYRGSGSYGKNFDDKGRAAWGRAMQDDLDDGMDWLAKRGVVDAHRVCLVGASYGGYAALWGATRNPERYRCAVSMAGISDLGRQLKYQLNSFDDKQSRERWRQKVQGDVGFDLRTVSALYNIDRLKVPVMLVHGDKDQTVPIKQSALYAAALKTAGKTYEYYVLPGEGHGFSNTASGQIWYGKLDAFLAKYNPAD